MWDRASRAPRNGRCRLHGGLSTGPRSQDGRDRIAAAQRRRWAESRASRAGDRVGRPVAPPRARDPLERQDIGPRAAPGPKAKPKTARLPRRRRPRPKLTPEFADRFCELVAKGHTPEIVAWVCRVPWEIVSRWLLQGARDRMWRRRNRFVGFLDRAERAAARARRLGLDAMYEMALGYEERDETVREHADGTREIRAVVRQKARPEAALWLLEQRWPDEWGRDRPPDPDFDLPCREPRRSAEEIREEAFAHLCEQVPAAARAPDRDTAWDLIFRAFGCDPPDRPRAGS